MSEFRWLDPREAAAWQAVRDLGQPLFTALGRDLQHDTGLSLADYQILVALSAQPAGILAYRSLAAATGWEKSRLSHQITRMEKRNLLQRRDCEQDGRSADIVLTARGRAAIERAAPGHVTAVRRLLLDRLTADQIETLGAIGKTVREALVSEGAASAHG